MPRGKGGRRGRCRVCHRADGDGRAGGTYLVSHGGQAPAYAVANVASNNLLFNGDDSVVLYTGSIYNFANVVDAFG